ncbi:hypothetical protein [Chryseobacterium sp. WLY505]|uniref:hypothetical protein n=1 Tax=Chryseobacterium sp. WLY505 TaxID=3068892 RepID=UPI002796B036|nr:hypothetical protein [Chryseobacterium sp. WLY505]MDQ1855794.1 hypothetical protein [Chryseobacterium sp. WLY505]
MKVLFENYKELLEERLNHKTLLSIGEDSIRYDFFLALLKTYNLKPYQIEIEVALNPNCFIPNLNEKSKRSEKPMIDLVLNTSSLKICAEFGLFRQNSNKDGTIDKTKRTVKMINDMIRASLHSEFEANKSFFICVADKKMLGHKMRNNFIGKFPSDYIISNDFIKHQLQQRTNKFDHRFLAVFSPLNKNIKSRVVYNEELKAINIKEETRLIIWETNLDK